MRPIRESVSCARVVVIAILMTGSVAPDDISERAKRVHFSNLVVDTHADTTQRFLSKSFDIGKRNVRGHLDIPRMREGGLSAVFLSIWMPGTVTGPVAVQRSLDQIAAVRETVARHRQDLVLATTAGEVRRARAQGKLAALMGMEGGHMISNDLSVLRSYAALGVRYMTLTHFLNNDWADASTDKPAHNGLTSFGKDVVREMNRLGVVVDISHVSDKSFYDALEVSRAPLMASHSSCRAICNHPRNMSDEMIRALAAKGGVIQINYHVGFLDQGFADTYQRVRSELSNRADQGRKACGDDLDCEVLEDDRVNRQMIAEGKLPHVSWEKIVEHIDHAVKLVGADHVGLGSDFDGATMPDGLEDCSKLPRLTEALLRKGYSESDIKKILGENTLRLMEEVERVSQQIAREAN